MSSNNDFDAQLEPEKLTIKNSPRGKRLGTSAEKMLLEQEVSPEVKLSLSAFSPEQKDDIAYYKLTKFKKRKGNWEVQQQISLSKFGLQKIEEFNRLLVSMDLVSSDSDTIKLDGVGMSGLNNLLRGNDSRELTQRLSNSELLTKDIFALDAKRKSLTKFEQLLLGNTKEPEWQSFFEENQWIFGLGLNFISLEKVGSKLEATTTGSDHNTFGKRADALMKTRAELSQCVLAEIKTSTTDLLQSSSYRGGCWAVSSQVSGAVAQAQKTAFEFAKKTFVHHLTDKDGNSTGETAYSIQPKSFLVVGNLTQLEGNDDKVNCFELFRRNIQSPEIITFDELYQRSKALLENLQADNA